MTIFNHSVLNENEEIILFYSIILTVYGVLEMRRLRMKRRLETEMKPDTQ